MLHTSQPSEINFENIQTDVQQRRTSFGDLKSTKIQLTWRDVTISASPPKSLCSRKKRDQPDFVILDSLNGTVKPGQFLAIIGASGAGKTTFLNFLSGKDPSRNLKKKGEVLINTIERSKINYSRHVGYVQQDDVLMQTLTVKECLTFAAKMKLPPGVDVEARVQELIESLKLDKAADTKIGGPLIKGVSGGERKRTSIGVELITDPSLIFLDEPTTGLDSFTASNVVEVLRNLAQTGRTVISTIHQPNSETFENFDQLLLMAQGKIIYQNSAQKSVSYFTKIGYKCPDRTNPADYFMNMMSIEAYEEPDGDAEAVQRSKTMIEESYKAKIIELYDKYESSEFRNNTDDVHPEWVSIKESENIKYRPNVFKQFWYLINRCFKNILRLPLASYVKVIATVIISILCILVYGQLGHDQQSIQSRTGALFFISTVSIMNSTTNVTLIFPDERPVFLREQSSRLYGATPYFFAKFFSELPIVIINSTLLFVLVYFSIKLNTDSSKQPLVFWGFYTLLSWWATGLGFMIGTMVSQKSVAVALTPITIIPLMLLSGFFVNQDNIVPILLPFQYISPFKYGFQVFILNEYDGLKLDCHPGWDPVGPLGFEETLNESIGATVGVGLLFYLGAFIVLQILSKRAS